VGIGVTPVTRLDVGDASSNTVARIRNLSGGGTNTNASFQLVTANNYMNLTVNEQYNYTQFQHAGNLVNHYSDVDNHYFRNKAGTQYLAMTGGRINTQSRQYGLVTHTTGVTLANNSSITIPAGTAGGGLMAIYNANSGRHATFGTGYGATYLIGESHSGAYVAGDVSGLTGVYSSNHSITIINRTGYSYAYFINMFMANSTAA